MLDALFFQMNKSVALAGSDWAVLGMVILMILAGIYNLIAQKVERLMQAGVAFLILLIATYVPFSMFQKGLEMVYLKLGLITTWYIDHSPEVLRFPTLWLTSLLFPVGTWLIFAILSDIVTGKPLLTHKLIKLESDKAKLLDLQMRAEWYEAAQKKKKNERIAPPELLM
jgi:hypothetical protein